MDNHEPVDPLERYARNKFYLAWIAFPVGYAYVLVQYPEYWAIATGIIFVIASGLFTSKVLLGLEGPWAVIGLAPVFGTGWMVFFWLLFKLVR